MRTGIRADCVIAKTAKIWTPVNLYGCTISENTIVGAFTEIGKDVIIGKNCKIQAHCFIPEGVVIEDNVFVGPGTLFCNDKHPMAKRDMWMLGRIIVENCASIGAGCVILSGIAIGEGAVIGAGSVVTKSVLPNTTVVGNPARKIKKV